MAFTIRILANGAPCAVFPVELYFNGTTRVDGFTDDRGEIIFDACPWADVHVTVNGIPMGVHPCREGGDVEIEMTKWLPGA